MDALDRAAPREDEPVVKTMVIKERTSQLSLTEGMEVGCAVPISLQYEGARRTPIPATISKHHGTNTQNDKSTWNLHSTYI